MKSWSNITTIAELEKEQNKLRDDIKVTRNELAKSIALNKGQAKEFLFKNILLPAGVVGLGVATVSKISSAKKSKKKENLSKKVNGFLPLVVGFVQSAFGKKQSDKILHNTSTPPHEIILDEPSIGER